MKWRLPADAWPATPGRNPCSISSSRISTAASAIRAGGTQTSSTISAVPGGRSRPIRPCMPSRTRQNSSTVSGSRVNSTSRKGACVSSTSRGGGLARVEARLVVGAELDEQRRRLERQLLPVLRRPGDRVGGDHQRRRDHQLDRGGAGGDELADRRRRRPRSTRSAPRRASSRRQRDGLEDRLGDEGERSLASRRAGGGRSRPARRRRGRRRAGSRSCS